MEDILGKLLAEGKTEQVIRQILIDKKKLNKSQQKEIILLSARYKEIRSKRRNGLITFEEESVEIARINAELIEMIQGYSGDLTPSIPRLDNIPKKIVKWGSITFGVVVGLFVVWLATQNTKSSKNALPQTFDLICLFYEDNANSNVLEKGRIRIAYDEGKTETLNIIEGKIKLDRLRNELRGTQIRLNPMIKGFEDRQIIKTIPIDSSNLNIYIAPVATHFSGIVIDTDQNIQANLELDFQGYRTKTDIAGKFELTIPYPPDMAIKYSTIENQKMIDQGMVTISNKPQTILIK